MMIEVTTDGKKIWINALYVRAMEVDHPCYAGSTVIWFGELDYLIVAETPREIARMVTVSGVRPHPAFLDVVRAA
jgi:hypothetical protein